MIQAPVGRTAYLGWASAEICDRRGCSVVAAGGLAKAARVQELRRVVVARIRILPSNFQRVATQAGGVGCGAGNREWLAIGGDENTVEGPSACKPCAGSRVQLELVLAEWKLVDSACVHNASRIDVAEPIVGANSHSRHVGGAITADVVIEQIARVAQALGISVSWPAG